MGYRDGLVAGLPGASLDRVVQLGCGGAGAATAYALLHLGARKLQLTDIDPARANDLASRMGVLFPEQDVSTLTAAELPSGIATATGIVHATPLGMLHHPGVAFDLDLLRPGTWVSDVVYRPLETELIRQAGRRGHPVLHGGPMAVGQACASLHIITGLAPDRERMQRHFGQLVSAEERARAGEGGL
jgi:shikimate dehydrogenase